MSKIVPLESWHLMILRLQPSQAHMQDWITPEFADACEASGASTLLIGEEPRACAGVSMVNGLPYGWALLSDEIGSHMTKLTRAVEQTLARHGGPIWTHCADCEANRRWLALLGFVPTGVTEQLPDGKAHELWRRA
jgi:hypothetical protein